MFLSIVVGQDPLQLAGKISQTLVMVRSSLLYLFNEIVGDDVYFPYLITDDGRWVPFVSLQYFFTDIAGDGEYLLYLFNRIFGDGDYLLYVFSISLRILPVIVSFSCIPFFSSLVSMVSTSCIDLRAWGPVASDYLDHQWWLSFTFSTYLPS